MSALVARARGGLAALVPIGIAAALPVAVAHAQIAPASDVFRAALATPAGDLVASCRAQSGDDRWCAFDVESLPPGAHRLDLHTHDAHIGGTFVVRGSEEDIFVSWPSHGPPYYVGTRLHRVPVGLELSLPTLGPDLPPRPRFLPVVRLMNSTPLTFRTERSYAGFYGSLFRWEDAGHWQGLRMRRRCDGMIAYHQRLAPGEHADVAPITYLLRDEVAAAARYQFLLSVTLDDPLDWDRHASALGAVPLGAADDAAFRVADVFHMWLELSGAEILAAQGAVRATEASGAIE